MDTVYQQLLPADEISRFTVIANYTSMLNVAATYDYGVK